jgi:YQGE family putative transporter
VAYRKECNMRKLTKDAVIFLFVQALYGLSIALSATFVNVFMWRLTSNMKYIVFQNMISSVTIVIMFILSGWISRKIGITTCIRLGILSNLLFYVVILLLKEKAKDYLIYLGFVSGSAIGFYFYAVNTLNYHYTNSENRANYFGLSGALGAIMGTVAPLISGYIIISKANLQGYYLVFLISFLLFLAAIIFSYFLTQIKEEGEYRLKQVLNKRSDKDWNRLMLSYLLMGFKDGSFDLLLGLLVYMVFQNELNMGKLSTFASILGIASTYLIGRVLNKRNQRKIFLIGAVMTFTSTIIIIIWTSYAGVIANSMLNAIFTCLWSIPMSNIAYGVVGKLSGSTSNIGDYMTALEVPIVIGRVTSLCLFLILNSYFDMKVAIRIALPILSFTIVINYILLTSRSIIIEEKNKARV